MLKQGQLIPCLKIISNHPNLKFRIIASKSRHFMEIYPHLQNKPPYIKLLIFIALIIAGLFFVNVLGLLLAVPFYGRSFLDGISLSGSVSDALYLSKLKYLQIVNQFALFIVPVVLFALFTGQKIHVYLKLNRKLPYLFALLSLALIITAIPIINWIGEMNASMKLPDAWAGLEQWMRNTENEAERLTKAFLGSVSVAGFLVNMLMIAVLPAIGEEMFFRGVLQRLFHEWFKNIHVAVVITAVIFSAIHFQFFGFIPRLVLGLLLGYVFYWSGNLWIPVLVHFLNNGLVVVISFISVRGYADIDWETFGSTSNGLILVSTFFIITALVFLLYRFRIVGLPPESNDSTIEQ